MRGDVTKDLVCACWPADAGVVTNYQNRARLGWRGKVDEGRRSAIPLHCCVLTDAPTDEDALKMLVGGREESTVLRLNAKRLAKYTADRIQHEPFQQCYSPSQTLRLLSQSIPCCRAV